MAMHACRDCGKEISNTARRCPHCGKYQWTGGRVGCAAFFVVIAVIILIIIIKA
jgi:RNA polymerase subunit RPABC4/transcription elongation factor Spt4